MPCRSLFTFVAAMKLFLRFLLSLTVLFSGGYGALYAKAQEQVKTQHSFDSHTWQQFSVLLDGHNSVLSYTPYQPADEANQLYATESEEDSNKWPTVKKHAEAGNYFTAFFHARITGYFQYHSDPLPFCKHSFHTAAHNCAVLQVFRI